MTRNNEPSYREKGRSLFLAALVVMSVFAMSAAFAGGATAATNNTANFSDFGDDREDVWFGQTITVENDSASDTKFDGPVRVKAGLSEEADDSSNDETVKTLRTNDDGHVEFDVDGDFEDGSPYYLYDTSEDNVSGTFWASTQEVTAEFDSDTVENAEDTTVDLNLTEDNREEEVDLEITGEYDGNALDNDTMSDIFGDADVEDGVATVENVELGDENITGADFDGQELGDYEFTVDVADSDASDTATIEVTEPTETDVSFSDNSYNDEQGDVLESTIDLEGASDIDNVYANISGDGYSAGLAIELGDDFEGDELTLQWNTYNAGHSGTSGNSYNSVTDGEVFTAVDEEGEAVENVEIEHEESIGDNRLATGGYSINIYNDDEARDNRADLATLSINERSTDDASGSIAPGSAFDVNGDDDLEDLLDETSDLSDASNEDLIVSEIDVSGIFGYAFDDNGDLTDEGNVSIDYQNLEEPTYGDAETFDAAGDDNTTIIPDAENNKVYVVTDLSGHDNITTDDDSDEWRTVLEVGEGNSYTDEDERAETDFSVVDAEHELDLVEEPYQVTPDADAEITGTSTYAPGTTFDVEVTQSGVFADTYEDVEVELNDDGERVWSIDADYSDREVGDEFEITVADNAAIDGVFADTPEEDTAASNEQLDALLDEYDAEDVDELNEYIAGLENDSEALAMLLEDNDADNASDLQDSIDELESENEELNSTIEELESENEELESENEELESENANLSDEVSSLEDEVADLESQLEDAENSNDDGDSDDSSSDDESSDDESSDDESSDDSSSDDESSDDGTPGFGVAVAAVALLAAAMLALRRQH